MFEPSLSFGTLAYRRGGPACRKPVRPASRSEAPAREAAMSDFMGQFRKGLEEEMERRWLTSSLAEWLDTPRLGRLDTVGEITETC
jgi:hypothetical protein